MKVFTVTARKVAPQMKVVKEMNIDTVDRIVHIVVEDYTHIKMAVLKYKKVINKRAQCSNKTRLNT